MDHFTTYREIFEDGTPEQKAEATQALIDRYGISPRAGVPLGEQSFLWLRTQLRNDVFPSRFVQDVTWPELEPIFNMQVGRDPETGETLRVD